MSEDLAYLAGALDCDGSIWIAVNTRAKGTSEIQFVFGLNLRQVERGRSLLELAANTFNVGNIIGPHKNGMLTWQIQSHTQVEEVLNKLHPFLRVKRTEADLMLEALDLWHNTPRESNPLGGRPKVPLWVKEKIKEISSQMNPSQQKETSRRNKDIRKFDAPELVGFTV